LLTITLASNFGTFLLYGLSCIICMVAYHNHPNFKVVRHLLIPLFGLVANLACMGFYIVGPFMGFGTKMEPLSALESPWSGPFLAVSTSLGPARNRAERRLLKARQQHPSPRGAFAIFIPLQRAGGAAYTAPPVQIRQSH